MIGRLTRALWAALTGPAARVPPETAAQVAAIALSCDSLMAECARLRIENEALRHVASENAIFASYHRAACALQGIEPATGERLQ